MWHPLKLEIEDWVDQKEREFAQEENQDPWLTPEQWLGKYVYYVILGIFFGEFPTLLNEWFLRLTLRKNFFQWGDPKSWTPKLIQKLKSVNNKISRAIDYKVNSILEVYIIEFVFNTIKSYSVVGRRYLRGHEVGI